MLFQQLPGGVGNAADFLACLVVEFGDEALAQGADVLAALAQRRQCQLEHGKAVVQVLAKPALGHGAVQILIGRGDDLHVEADFTFAADPANDFILDGGEQFGLQVQRQFAQFVEKQRTAVGLFKQAAAARPGAGKCTCLVAEQFGLHQFMRNRSAIHLHQRRVGAAAAVVQDARRQAFAGAGFATDEQRRIGHRREPREHVAGADRSGAGTAEAVYVVASRLRCHLVRDAALRATAARGACDNQRQPFQVARLGEEIQRAEFERAHRIRHGAVAGEENPLGADVLLARLFEKIQAVAIGQIHVRQHHQRGKLVNK